VIYSKNTTTISNALKDIRFICHTYSSRISQSTKTRPSLIHERGLQTPTDSTIQTRGTKYASHAPDCLTGRQISVISEKIVRRRPAERSLEDSSRVTSLYYHYGGQRDGAPASSIWLQINDRRVCQVTKN
jgi:hypothetical protein